MMATALRAGLSVRQAVETVAAELPAPAGLEFAGIAQKLSVGLPLDETLDAAAARLPITEMRILTTTLVVQHQTGGNLPRALDALAGAIRGRQRLRDEIRVGTAQARYQTTVLLLLPLFFRHLVVHLSGLAGAAVPQLAGSDRLRLLPAG